MSGPNFTTPVRVVDGNGKTVVELGTNGEVLVNGDSTGATGARLGADAKGSYLVLIAGKTVRARMRASVADLLLGGNGAGADVVLFPAGASIDAAFEQSSIHMSADSSQITMRSGGQTSMIIDGKLGDIVLMNADGAEEFEVDEDAGIGPGAVLAVGDNDRLRLADRPYDRGVAGVVSGAGDLRPGIVLGRVPGGRRMPLALFGKVHCQVDATYGAVARGDLLTTSLTPGHAMRAEPGGGAMGAVLGKALRDLPSGTGLVPVLVALQ